MYKSPIELLVTDIQNQIVKQHDEEIYKAVLHYIPNIDKEELIRALQYDRGQYEKGYVDGKREAMDSIVRCKDCRHSILPELMTAECTYWHEVVGINGFCHHGERRE